MNRVKQENNEAINRIKLLLEGLKECSDDGCKTLQNDVQDALAGIEEFLRTDWIMNIQRRANK